MSIEAASAPYLTAMQHWEFGRRALEAKEKEDFADSLGWWFSRESPRAQVDLGANDFAKEVP
ncbi:MAG: hypothetical protein ABSE87_01455 [Terracidiphilus sp.]|jgi:hypothetical protein